MSHKKGALILTTQALQITLDPDQAQNLELKTQRHVTPGLDPNRIPERSFQIKIGFLVVVNLSCKQETIF